MKQRLAGTAFLLVIALLLWLSVALYQKRFADVVEVELATDRIGNQLTVNGDVKVRGVIVGRITEVDSDGDRASVTMAIDRSKADLVPRDAVGRLLPKTLFGEKYVALMTEDADDRPVREGDVLQQDRSAEGIETAQVLDDLLPLLKALDPEDLSATLGAVSEAVRGRGDQLGASLVRTRDYLEVLNPELPTVQQDLRGLADLADTLDEASPDLLAVLDDLSFSSRALQDQEGQLARFLSTTTAFSASADSVLRQNEQRLIRLASESRAPLELYDNYAPISGCFLRAMVEQDRVIGTTFGGNQPGLRITLEVTRDQGGFLPGDEPVNAESRTSCYGLDERVEGNFPVYAEPRDGYNDEREAATPGVQTGRSGPGALPNDETGVPPPGIPVVQARSAGLLKVLSGPVIGTAPEEVPDLADLLVGPLLRGATVSYATVPTR